MKHNTLLALFFTATLFAFSSVFAAEEDLQIGTCVEKSYGEKMGDKALSGFVNMNTAILEMPKATINTVNDSNIALGMVGGAIKGALHTAGRFTAGLADLLTFWLPTEPIADPAYVWEDFDADTTYGKAFRLPKKNPNCVEPQ